MDREKNLRILEAYCKKINSTNIYTLCEKVAKKILGAEKVTYPVENRYLNLFFDIDKYKDRYRKKLDLNSTATCDWYTPLNESFHALFTRNKKEFFKIVRAINRS